MILVGNKQDVPAELREVTPEEGALMAAQNHCSFLETSALRDVNVHDLFLQLLHRGFESAAPPSSAAPNEVTPELRRGGSRSTRRKLGRSRSAGVMAVPVAGSVVVANGGSRSGSRATSRGPALGPRTNSASAREVVADEFGNDEGRCVIL